MLVFSASLLCQILTSFRIILRSYSLQDNQGQAAAEEEAAADGQAAAGEQAANEEEAAAGEQAAREEEAAADGEEDTLEEEVSAEPCPK